MPAQNNLSLFKFHKHQSSSVCSQQNTRTPLYAKHFSLIGLNLKSSWIILKKCSVPDLSMMSNTSNSVFSLASTTKLCFILFFWVLCRPTMLMLYNRPIKEDIGTYIHTYLPPYSFIHQFLFYLNNIKFEHFFFVLTLFHFNMTKNL